MDRDWWKLSNDPTSISHAQALAANPMGLFYKPVPQKPDPEYITAGDEVVFGKAGQETYGIGRFFSSLQNRVIPGLSFFTFSVIDVKEQKSYPIQAVQMIKEKEEKSKKEKEKLSESEKRPVGRSKGSRNKRTEKPAAES